MLLKNLTYKKKLKIFGKELENKKLKIGVKFSTHILHNKSKKFLQHTYFHSE